MTALVRPHRGPHTQAFGNIQPDGQPHAGDDFGYTDGVNVYPEVFAAAAGEVIYAGDARNLGWPNPFYLNPDFDRTDAQDSSAGNVVVLDHGDGMTTYNHLESIQVRKGDRVVQAQRIATTGDTGFSFGKHLHFEWIPYPANFGTATYGRARPSFISITPQAAKPKELFTVSQYAALNAKLDTLIEATKPINTASGKKTLRDFVAAGTRAAEEARDNTAAINVTGGQESLRSFVAKGTRASQANAARLAALEAALKAVLENPAGIPLEAVTDAAAAGAERALANLTGTIELESRNV
jgi:hypothetical protein